MLTRSQIAARAAKELQDGNIVNLGIGLPTAVLHYIPKNINITFQSENGILGMGPPSCIGQEDPDLIDAGKRAISDVVGASFFSSADSFSMIRGGHIDIAILGAMQVSDCGDIANWMIPGKMVKGMGGAMDLVSGAKKIIVTMEHCSKDGTSKLLEICNLPLTGAKCVDLIITNLGVFNVTKNNGLHLTEIARGVTLDNLRNKTRARLTISKDLKTVTL